MDEKMIQKAVNDISTIKEMIDRTGKSFTSFSKIFIYWGLLFILQSIIGLFMSANTEQVLELFNRYNMLSYLFPVPIFALVAALIYYSVSRKIPLIGLEKHLMKIWLLILVLNILPKRIEILTSSGVGNYSAITVVSNNLNVLYFSLAIALIVTSLFTGYKHPMYLGALYIAISLVDTYFNLSLDNNTLNQLVHAVALPGTFLYTGFYLRSKQLGGTPIGNKLDS